MQWRELKPTTKARNLSILRVHVLPHWSDVPVNRITTRDVEAWVVWLDASETDPDRKTLAPATVVKIVAVFHTALNVAVRHGNLRTNPAASVPRPRVPESDMLFLDEQEVNALAAAVPPRYRAVILLAAWTGMRAGEVWGLKRKRLNTLTGKLTVAETLVSVDGVGLVTETPKTHKPRTVLLPPFLRRELDAHLSEFTEGGTGPDALVFTRPGGNPVAQTDFLRYVFRPAVRSALPERLHGLRFHDLRHTAASLMIAQKLSFKFIADQLGHEDIRMTVNRYGHRLLSMDDAAMRDLEAAYQAASQQQGQPA